MAKGIGIVLNQLASMSKTLMGIGGEMQKLGSVASKIGDALGKAFQFAKEKAVDAFEFIKDAFEPLLKVMRSLWDGIVMPIWDLLKNGMMLFFNLFTGQWSKALGNAKSIWDGTIGVLWDGFTAALTFAFDGLESAAKRVFSGIRNAWSSLTGFMSRVYDNTLGRLFGLIGDALERVYNFGKDIFGGGGGGGGSTTNVGTAVSGGATYNFDMTFNLSGMTDATDKRAMAREIGDLVQQEISRSSGGGRARGRYT
tara:strand:+ start:7127 stop:7888 length:762 start_codon:yes stop_codon:yes gene_type:complete